MTEPLVPREEARAALEAQRELGPAYDDVAVERFAQRIEERLRERAPARRAPDQQKTATAVVSLIVSIPLIAIAGNYAQEAGIALVCLALVLVNYFAARS